MLLRSLELLSVPYMEAAAVTVSEPTGKVVSLYSNMGHGPLQAVEEKKLLSSYVHISVQLETFASSDETFCHFTKKDFNP